MYTHKLFYKITSLMTAFAFLANTCFADVLSLKKTDMRQLRGMEMADISIPAYLGEITDSQNLKKGKTIIHIQDAHCNYSCQHSISGLISYLHDKYGLKKVMLEGGAGEYDLSLFTDVKDNDVREKISDFFVKEGRVNGAEYFAVNNPEKITLHGLEKPELYLANLSVYKESLVFKEDAARILARVSSLLSTLKVRSYPKELLELDTNARNFADGTMDMHEYIKYLFGLHSLFGKNIRVGDDLARLALTVEKENEVDFNAANADRENLIAELMKKLSSREIESLVLMCLKFKNGSVGQSEFYAYLFKKAASAGIDMDLKYPGLSKYREYIEVYESVDKGALFSEINALEEQLFLQMCRTPVQTELHARSKDLKTVEDLFHVSISAEKYSEYVKNKDANSCDKLMNFIREECPHEAQDKGLFDDIKMLYGYRVKMEKFYEVAHKRNTAFIENIRSWSNTKEPLVIITGGFHTDALKELFKRNGYSYITVMPALSECGTSPYFNILSGGLTPFEKALSSGNSLIQTPGLLDPLGQKATLPEIAKLCRVKVQILEEACLAGGPVAVKLSDGKYLVVDASGETPVFNTSDDPGAAKVISPVEVTAGSNEVASPEAVQETPGKINIDVFDETALRVALMDENLDIISRGGCDVLVYGKTGSAVLGDVVIKIGRMYRSIQASDSEKTLITHTGLYLKIDNMLRRVVDERITYVLKEAVKILLRFFRGDLSVVWSVRHIDMPAYRLVSERMDPGKYVPFIMLKDVVVKRRPFAFFAFREKIPEIVVQKRVQRMLIDDLRDLAASGDMNTAKRYIDEAIQLYHDCWMSGLHQEDMNIFDNMALYEGTVRILDGGNVTDAAIDAKQAVDEMNFHVSTIVEKLRKTLPVELLSYYQERVREQLTENEFSGIRSGRDLEQARVHTASGTADALPMFIGQDQVLGGKHLFNIDDKKYPVYRMDTPEGERRVIVKNGYVGKGMPHFLGNRVAYELARYVGFDGIPAAQVMIEKTDKGAIAYCVQDYVGPTILNYDRGLANSVHEALNILANGPDNAGQYSSLAERTFGDSFVRGDLFRIFLNYPNDSWNADNIAISEDGTSVVWFDHDYALVPDTTGSPKDVMDYHRSYFRARYKTMAAHGLDLIVALAIISDDEINALSDNIYGPAMEGVLKAAFKNYEEGASYEFDRSRSYMVDKIKRHREMFREFAVWLLTEKRAELPIILRDAYSDNIRGISLEELDKVFGTETKTGVQSEVKHGQRDVLNVAPEEILSLMRAQFVREHSGRVMEIARILVQETRIPSQLAAKIDLAAAGHDFDSPLYPVDRNSPSAKSIVASLREKGVEIPDKPSADVARHNELREYFAAHAGQFDDKEISYALDLFTGPSAIYGMGEHGISFANARPVAAAIIYHHNIDQFDSYLRSPDRAKEGWTDAEKEDARIILSVLVAADIIENGMNMFKKIACRNSYEQEAPETTLRFFPPEIFPFIREAYGRLVARGDGRLEAVRRNAALLSTDEQAFLRSVGRMPGNNDTAIVYQTENAESVTQNRGSFLLRWFRRIIGPVVFLVAWVYRPLSAGASDGSGSVVLQAAGGTIDPAVYGIMLGVAIGVALLVLNKMLLNARKNLSERLDKAVSKMPSKYSSNDNPYASPQSGTKIVRDGLSFRTATVLSLMAVTVILGIGLVYNTFSLFETMEFIDYVKGLLKGLFFLTGISVTIPFWAQEPDEPERDNDGNDEPGNSLTYSNICEKEHTSSARMLKWQLSEFYDRDLLYELSKAGIEKDIVTDNDVADALELTGRLKEHDATAEQLKDMIAYIHDKGSIPEEVQIWFAIPKGNKLLWWVANPDWTRDVPDEDIWHYAGGYFGGNLGGTDKEVPKVYISLPFVFAQSDPREAALNIARHEYEHLLGQGHNGGLALVSSAAYKERPTVVENAERLVVYREGSDNNMWKMIHMLRDRTFRNVVYPVAGNHDDIVRFIDLAYETNLAGPFPILVINFDPHHDAYDNEEGLHVGNWKLKVEKKGQAIVVTVPMADGILTKGGLRGQDGTIRSPRGSVAPVDSRFLSKDDFDRLPELKDVEITLPDGRKVPVREYPGMVWISMDFDTWSLTAKKGTISYHLDESDISEQLESVKTYLIKNGIKVDEMLGFISEEFLSGRYDNVSDTEEWYNATKRIFTNARAELLRTAKRSGDTPNVTCGTVCEAGHQEILDPAIEEYYTKLAAYAVRNGMSQLKRDLKRMPMKEKEVIEALSLNGILKRYNVTKEELKEIIEFIHRQGIPDNGDDKVEILFAIPNPDQIGQALWWVENPDWKEGDPESNRMLYAGAHYRIPKNGDQDTQTRIHISLPLVLAEKNRKQAALKLVQHDYQHIRAIKTAGIEPGPEHNGSDEGFALVSRISEIDNVLRNMKMNLETMDMMQRYTVPGRGTDLHPSDVFFMNRSVDEIIESGMCADCDESAYVFYDLMSKKGYTVKLVCGVELTTAGFMYKNRSHTIVAVYDWQNNNWIAVDPERGLIMSLDWDENSKWYDAFLGLHYWVWYKGDMENYRGMIRTNEDRTAQLSRALRTVDLAWLIEDNLVSFRFVEDPEKYGPKYSDIVREYIREEKKALEPLRARFGRDVWETIPITIASDGEEVFNPYFSDGVLHVSGNMIKDKFAIANLHFRIRDIKESRRRVILGSADGEPEKNYDRYVSLILPSSHSGEPEPSVIRGMIGEDTAVTESDRATRLLSNLSDAVNILNPRFHRRHVAEAELNEMQAFMTDDIGRAASFARSKVLALEENAVTPRMITDKKTFLDNVMINSASLDAEEGVPGTVGIITDDGSKKHFIISPETPVYVSKAVRNGHTYTWVGFERKTGFTSAEKWLSEYFFLDGARVAHGFADLYGEVLSLRMGIDRDRVDTYGAGEMKTFFGIRQSSLSEIYHPAAFTVPAEQIPNWQTLFFYLKRGFVPLYSVNRRNAGIFLDAFYDDENARFDDEVLKGHDFYGCSGDLVFWGQYGQNRISVPGKTDTEISGPATDIGQTGQPGEAPSIGKYARVVSVNEHVLGGTAAAAAQVENDITREVETLNLHRIAELSMSQFKDDLLDISTNRTEHEAVMELLFRYADFVSPRIYTFYRLINDLFGFSALEGRVIGIYKDLENDRVALFHEFAEAMMASGFLSLKIIGNSIEVNAKGARTLLDMGAAPAELVSEGEIWSGWNADRLNMQEYAHYRIRMLQRVLFGEHDRELTKKIRTTQIDSGMQVPENLKRPGIEEFDSLKTRALGSLIAAGEEQCQELLEEAEWTYLKWDDLKYLPTDIFIDITTNMFAHDDLSTPIHDSFTITSLAVLFMQNMPEERKQQLIEAGIETWKFELGRLLQLAEEAVRISRFSGDRETYDRLINDFSHAYAAYYALFPDKDVMRGSYHITPIDYGDARTLDVGTGIPGIRRGYLWHYDSQLVLLDENPFIIGAIKRYFEYLGIHNVSAVEGSVFYYAPAQKFDHVRVGHMLHHLGILGDEGTWMDKRKAARKKTFENINSLLNEGGILHISDRTDEFNDLLGADFEEDPITYLKDTYQVDVSAFLLNDHSRELYKDHYKVLALLSAEIEAAGFHVVIKSAESCTDAHTHKSYIRFEIEAKLSPPSYQGGQNVSEADAHAEDVTVDYKTDWKNAFGLDMELEGDIFWIRAESDDSVAAQPPAMSAGSVKDTGASLAGILKTSPVMPLPCTIGMAVRIKPGLEDNDVDMILAERFAEFMMIQGRKVGEKVRVDRGILDYNDPSGNIQYVAYLDDGTDSDANLGRMREFSEHIRQAGNPKERTFAWTLASDGRQSSAKYLDVLGSLNKDANLAGLNGEYLPLSWQMFAGPLFANLIYTKNRPEMNESERVNAIVDSIVRAVSAMTGQKYDSLNSGLGESLRTMTIDGVAQLFNGLSLILDLPRIEQVTGGLDDIEKADKAIAVSS